MKIEGYKKSDIGPEDIKANILNYAILRLDYKGLLSMDSFILDFQNYLSEKEFIIEEERLALEHIEILEDAMLYQNYIDKDIVYRFHKKNSTVKINVSRFFTYVYLDYNQSHSLKEKIYILNDLINIIKEKNKFVVFEKISLKKSNSVLVSPMNKILNCFETRLFNDVSFEINRLTKRKLTDLLFSKSTSKFIWDDIIFCINKEIAEGYTTLNNKEKDCYEVILDIEGSIKFDNFLEANNQFSYDIKCSMEKININIFEIFKLCLNKSLLEDLKYGNSEKLLKGMNNNE